ncbi:MAG: hypothetical protein L6264_11895 [Weeksellaceae bacterium]|nr:hypothetical protein [Bacteroidota bacterium]MCG2781640.1 hypothetical protein [Weeksellaceae bacterium]
MNTSLKIAIGLAATAAGTLAVAVLRKRKGAEQQQFTAPDGTTYRKGERYHSADQKTYLNGREIRQEKPADHFLNDRNTSPSSYPNDAASNHYDGAVKNVQYHQRGVRHR